MDLTILHLHQLDFYGAWRVFEAIDSMDHSRQAKISQWLRSLYELYHFQIDHVFASLQEIFEEGWISRDQFLLILDHVDHLMHYDGMTSEFLLDILKDAVHHMEMYLGAGDYMAFLARLYRFRELLILFLLVEAGKKDRVDVYQPGHAPDYLKVIENAYLNHELASYYGVYMFLQSKQLTDVIHLRNHSFVGHGHLGVTSTNVWQSYEGKWHQSNSLSVQAFLSDMQILFQDLGTELGNNPFSILTQGLEKALGDLKKVFPLSSRQVQKETVFEEDLNEYQYYALLNLVTHGKLPPKLQQPLEFAISLMLGSLTVDKCHDMRNLFDHFAQFRNQPTLLALFIPLAKGNQVSFINYLFAQLHVFLSRHDYGELLIRVYRLMEELMIYFLGYDVDKETTRLVIRHRVEPRIRVERHTFSGLIEAMEQAAKSEPESAFFFTVKEKWWLGISDLYRHSIVGHGSEAITKEHLEAILSISVPEMIERLRRVMRSLGIQVFPNYFDLINEFIAWRYQMLLK